VARLGDISEKWNEHIGTMLDTKSTNDRNNLRNREIVEKYGKIWKRDGISENDLGLDSAATSVPVAAIIPAFPASDPSDTSAVCEDTHTATCTTNMELHSNIFELS
jgi:hypothetical protein